MRLSRLFWPMLKEAKGHLVNIIGGAARTPDAEILIGGWVNAAMYNFHQGAVRGGQARRRERERDFAGLTETERVEQLFKQRADATGTSMDEAGAWQIAKEGLTRLGTPEDVAALALFLCSEAARHIQGTAIAVDGGAAPGLY